MQHPVEPPQSHSAPAVKRLRALTYLLDNSIPIPGTRLRFGIDPILGLLPGAGDVLSNVLAVYIVFEATRLGIPRESLLRMVGNLLLDTAVGSVPALGDMFDFGFKANLRNYKLIESHLNLPPAEKLPPARKVDKGFIILLLVGFLILTIAIAALSVTVVYWLVRAIRG
ncbi:MAG: DUF4112 domain-containing protein [Scytolyngbya sp. HA4215-MV1]|jgi:hypothetical protein|nr:DUF4112 domain-containing protein [Scytolyngbya sp. HA4215-MV1]